MSRVIFLSVIISLVYSYITGQYNENPYVETSWIQINAPFLPLSSNPSISQQQSKIYLWRYDPGIPAAQAISIHLSVTSISFSNIYSTQASPFYKCEIIKDGAINYFTLQVTVSANLNDSLIRISYILIDRQCPLYFRAFQYDINIPSTPSIDLINYTSISNEALPLNKSLKVTFSIIGSIFSTNIASSGLIPKNLIYLDSMGLKYNTSGLDPKFISGLTVSIAVFETSTVLNQKVYVFDTISYSVKTKSPTPLMTMPYGIKPEYTGVMEEQIAVTGLSYSYQVILLPQTGDQTNIQSKLNETVLNSNIASTNIVASFFLHGIFGCSPFILTSFRSDCQNVCNSNLTIDSSSSSSTVDWNIACSVCLTTRVCLSKKCGDGFIDQNEQCDLGFQNGQLGRGCSMDCEILAGYYCNDVNGIGSMCSPRCGDSIVAIGSQTCDNGDENGESDNGCSNNCSIVPGFYCQITVNYASECQTRCGDNLKTTNEQCDLGGYNGQIGFGCSQNCTIILGFYCVANQDLSSYCQTECGDGIVAGTETCDTRYFNGQKASGCNKKCQIIDGFKCTLDSGLTSHCVSVCGDGIVAENEGCDTGKVGDGCSANCTVLPGFYCKNNVSSVCSPVCGDGIVAGNEKCDLGKNYNKARYGCSEVCTIFRGFYCEITSNFTSVCTTKCGDSIVVGTQVCDNGQSNGVILNGCSNECQALPGFYCSITSALTSFCVTYCGDGYASGKEQCDDGNNTGKEGYGCGSDCVPKTGYHCTISIFTSVCSTQCGDGVVMGTEACDTGNFSNPQTYGCASDCTIMPGFDCSVGPTFGSVCTSKCGDGVAVAAFEACDNGPYNGSPGNGCTLDCTVTIGFVCKIRDLQSFCETFCGDGIVAGSEECDEGSSNGQPLSACSEKCSVNQGFYCKFVDASLHCFPFCGDGLVVGYEQCDSGPSNGKFGQPCNSNCSAFAGYYNCSSANNATVCATLCGDSVVAGKEECDLGLQNGIANSFCSSVCALNSGVCIPIDPNFSCISFSLNTQNTQNLAKAH